MKKHKSHKKNYRTQVTPAKRSFFAKAFRNLGLAILLVTLFFSTMYGFRCFATKVCGSIIVDKIIRHGMTVLMPKGALEVEVADTQASRELGLSGREKIGDDEGLLFVFDEPGRYGFWMKDMKFSLDMVWINQNGVVVDIERNVTPESYKQKKTYINQSEAAYVLEINAGLAEKFGLYLGSKVKITD